MALVLVLLLPVGAFVAGSLAASSTDTPARRAPIVLTEPSSTPTPTPRGRPDDPTPGSGTVVAPKPGGDRPGDDGPDGDDGADREHHDRDDDGESGEDDDDDGEDD